MSVLTVSLAEKITGKNAAQIQRVDASDRRLGEVKDLSGCGQLVRLDLSRNTLGGVGGVGGCGGLTWLDLSHNQLDSLAGLQRLVNLSVLRASNNSLTSCPDLSPLPKLKALILSHNHLSCLPGLSALRDLNTLVISHNEFESIDVGKLRRLSKLSIAHNYLKTVPNTQSNPELRELRLNGNKIGTLPESLQFNKKLKIVDVGNNNLKAIRVLQPLKSLYQLGNLNLKGNPLCESPGYPQEVLRLVPPVRILDGARVENIQSGGSGTKAAKEAKTFVTKLSGEDVDTEREKRAKKRKRQTAETEREEEDITDGALPLKKRPCRTHSAVNEKTRTLPKRDSLAGDLDGELERVTKSKLIGPGSRGLPPTGSDRVGEKQSATASKQPAGVKTSLKKTARGRSGVLAVEEVRGKRRKKSWKPLGDHLVGSGQPSTWT